MRFLRFSAAVLVVAVPAGAWLFREHPSVSRRIALLERKITGGPPPVTWSQLTVMMSPGSLRPQLRDLLQPVTPSLVADLKDYPPEPDAPFTLRPFLDGPTGSMERLDGHYSILDAGASPHPPHVHEEEELIVPLSGEVVIVREADGELYESVIGAGAFTYHASNRPHTIRAVGPGPSTYLVLKWKGRWSFQENGALESQDFEYGSRMASDANRGFAVDVLFEAPTSQLGKLHAHTSAMAPGGGYNEHRDAHDVAILVLEGELETLGKRVGPHSVIFYPADSLHGMGNPGSTTARYLVFEFHSAVSL